MSVCLSVSCHLTCHPACGLGMYVVAIDWPGHGLSSHRPVGVVYDASHYVMDIKFIVDGERVCL